MQFMQILPSFLKSYKKDIRHQLESNVNEYILNVRPCLPAKTSPGELDVILWCPPEFLEWQQHWHKVL